MSWYISKKNLVGFEQMMKLSMNLLIFPMVNTFSWGGRGGIKLLSYHQMTKIPLLFFVIDFSSPFKIFKLQNFTSVPPPTSSNHIVGRRVLTPLFYEDPLYIAKLPFFKFCPTPLPCCLQPPALLLILLLFLWLNGWSCHIWCTILLNDIMDVHMSSLRILMHVLCNKVSSLLSSDMWCGFLLVL